MCEPFYSAESGDRMTIRLAGDRPATLLRFRTDDWLGRTLAALRGKSWRSPAAKLSRLMFHLHKAGVPVPQLFAFGQRLTRFGPADSFLAHEQPAGSVTLADWRNGPTHADDRERLLVQLGGLVRGIHDADCTLGPARPAVRVVITNSRPRLMIDPTHGAALVGHLGERQRLDELVDLLRAFELSPEECRRVLDGYAPTPAFGQRVLRRAVTTV